MQQIVKRRTVLTGVIIAALSVASIADDNRRAPGGKLMDRLDVDGDGQLSAEEFTFPRDRKRGLVEQADADGDGKVTRDEFDAMLAERASKSRDLFESMDSNSDSVITADEIKLTLFSQIDTDASGYISAQELTVHQNQRRKGRRGD